MSALSTPASPPAARRRLLPAAAVGIAVAAIGLPLVFLHGHDAAAPATPAAPAASAPKSAPALTPHAATAHPVHGAPSGSVSDPFARAITASKTPGSASAAPSSSASPANTGTSPGSTSTTVTPSHATTPATTTVTTTPTSTTPTTPVVAAPAHPWRVYRADVRVSPARGSAVHHKLTRLTPLPSAQAPFVIYLGAVHGDRAAFLLNRLASASGSGRCAKFDGPYQALYLKPGQTERVSIPFFGSAVTYRVGLVRVHGRVATSAAAASHANRSVSKSGHALLGRYGLLGSLHFSGAHGVLPAPKNTHACG
ncbi:MAG: hypothetical protein JWN32_3255 [Solirubrobacterales bacterium]|jgi:hypothetical protein|nr:hypothetical protein [Solirubrobacterales bacterium]